MSQLSIADGTCRRLPDGLLEARLAGEAMLADRHRHHGKGIFVLDRFLPVNALVRLALKCSGLYARANRAALGIRVVENEIFMPGLPESFEGFRLLQLSDLHCDIEPLLIDAVISVVEREQFDLCVLTGDYHNRIGESYQHSLELMERLIPFLGCGPLAILGNHDFLGKVEPLEQAGLRVLINENVEIQRAGESVWICGVDDPHFFRTHDLIAAARGAPDHAVKILLAHSPEIYREAAEAGFALQLSGHTHGGQLCLPGGIPVVRSANVPLRLVAGAWRHGRMIGYTSRGTGCCGVAARLNCPPEITIHILRRA